MVESLILEVAKVCHSACYFVVIIIILFFINRDIKISVYFMPWRLCDSRNLHHEIESRSLRNSCCGIEPFKIALFREIQICI